MSVWKCPVCGSFMQHREEPRLFRGRQFRYGSSYIEPAAAANRKHTPESGNNGHDALRKANFLDAGHYRHAPDALEQAAVTL